MAPIPPFGFFVKGEVAAGRPDSCLPLFLFFKLRRRASSSIDHRPNLCKVSSSFCVWFSFPVGLVPLSRGGRAGTQPSPPLSLRSYLERTSSSESAPLRKLSVSGRRGCGSSFLTPTGSSVRFSTFGPCVATSRPSSLIQSPPHPVDVLSSFGR